MPSSIAFFYSLKAVAEDFITEVWFFLFLGD
jgi:hypothetical protein